MTKKSKLREAAKGGAGIAARAVASSPYAMAAVVIILAVMGIISVILWFLSPMFRFVVYVMVATGIVVLLHKFLEVRKPLYLLGSFAGVVVVLMCANVFMSSFPESGLIPVKAGAEIVEKEEIEFATSQLIFLSCPPIIASLGGALITMKLKGRRLYVVLGTFAILIALMFYLLMWGT